MAAAEHGSVQRHSTGQQPVDVKPVSLCSSVQTACAAARALPLALMAVPAAQNTTPLNTGLMHDHPFSHHVVHQEVHAGAWSVPGAVEAAEPVCDGIHRTQQVALEVEPGRRARIGRSMGLHAMQARERARAEHQL